MSDNVRIAKNTLYLYLRMIVVMLVSIYTSRVILHNLGAIDFGIYNVVGGVVMMASFLNAALSVASSRFLTYELGRNDSEKLKKTFSASLCLHIGVALIVIVMGETIGLWFFSEKLVIPESRITAASWIYQFSILSMLISFTQVPYTSALIAHENMSIYAYIGLYEAISKLTISFLIAFSPFDNLIFYGFLILINSIAIQLFLRLYTRRNYEECRFTFVKDRALYKSLFDYCGWNLVGGFSYIIQNQGISILLNMFFGPIVNAARAITTQIQNALLSLVNNFLVAVRPQVVKSFATSQFEEMYQLTFRSGKYAMFLMSMLTIPVCFELGFILDKWLGDDVPEHTYMFTEIVLVTNWLDMFCQIINLPFGAIGKMKVGNLVGGIIQMLALPLGYILLVIGYGPSSVFIAIMITIILKTIGMWIITHKYVPFSWNNAFNEVFSPSFYVTMLALIVPIVIVSCYEKSWTRLVINVIFTELSLLIIIYSIGIKDFERLFFKQLILKKINKYL